jgi:hypothetical protein
MNTKELVRLCPKDEGNLHPVALRRLLEWGEKLSKKIPLATLSFEDLATWLNEDELAQWRKEVEEIREWLAKCLDDKYSIYCHADWVTWHMMEIEKLIERVWQRKSRWVQEQQKWKEAERKSFEYARELNNQVNSFKTNLSHKKRSIQWPKKARALGYDFSYLLNSDEKARCRNVAGDWVQGLVPDNLRRFITFNHRLFYCLLPSAEYSLVDNVPCLDFGFLVFLTIEAEFWLKPAEVLINGYKFMMPQEEQTVRIPEGKVVASYFVQLTKSELLGYDYRLLTPKELAIDEFNYFSWETIPCALILGLLEGNPEPDGCTITAVHEGWTHYRVDDFDEELKIPDSFAQYLKDIGSWDSLADRGIISSKLVITIKKAIERLKVSKIPEPCLSDNDDVVSALVALGWRQAEAKREVKTTNFSSDLTLEDKIKLILRKSYNQQV